MGKSVTNYCNPTYSLRAHTATVKRRSFDTSGKLKFHIPIATKTRVALTSSCDKTAQQAGHSHYLAIRNYLTDEHKIYLRQEVL